MNLLLFLLLLLPSTICLQMDHSYWSNQPNRSLVILAAPSVWDGHYQRAFLDIVQFQIDFALTIKGHDNVLVIADKHTLPYFEGRSHKVKRKLSRDMLLEGNIYDVRIRDFAFFDSHKTAKFIYRWASPRTLP